jgi:hypothetical protein
MLDDKYTIAEVNLTSRFKNFAAFRKSEELLSGRAFWIYRTDLPRAYFKDNSKALIFQYFNDALHRGH